MVLGLSSQEWAQSSISPSNLVGVGIAGRKLRQHQNASREVSVWVWFLQQHDSSKDTERCMLIHKVDHQGVTSSIHTGCHRAELQSFSLPRGDRGCAGEQLLPFDLTDGLKDFCCQPENKQPVLSQPPLELSLHSKVLENKRKSRDRDCGLWCCKDLFGEQSTSAAVLIITFCWARSLGDRGRKEHIHSTCQFCSIDLKALVDREA